MKTDWMEIAWKAVGVLAIVALIAYGDILVDLLFGVGQ